MRKHFSTKNTWLVATIWISLVLIAPQISFTKYVPDRVGIRAIHPFFHWHLFSTAPSPKAPTFFAVSIDSCNGNALAPPVDLMNVLLSTPSRSNKAWRYYNRLRGISGLIMEGDIELAKLTLQRLIETQFPERSHCQATFSWKLNDQPREKVLEINVGS